MKRFLFLFPLAIAACAHIPSPQERITAADDMARVRGWHAQLLNAAPFALTAYAPPHPRPAALLTVYIEGDGLAWITDSQPSDDPTPADPMALRLALAQPQGAAAYLARPCQYAGISAPRCSNNYWTGQRFSEEAIASTDRALDLLMRQFGARQLALVGYSGGGAVAALVAARRTDVIRLVTVAGNLDHRAWTAWHRVAPLAGSLNPADAAGALQTIPQWHFAGSRDTTMPPQIAASYAERFARDHRPAIIVVDGFDHHCCWEKRWPEFLGRSLVVRSMEP